MNVEPIYTEKRECRDCYKCVRACPVKAIQVSRGSAVVCHDRCLFCGKCVAVCPAHAKKVRNDIPRAKSLLAGKEHVYVSLAPSFSAEFAGYTEQALKAIGLLGFSGISETALGAEAVTAEVVRLLEDRSTVKPQISTACPTVVEAVRKYHPELMRLLTPVHSPLGAHSRQLRARYGEDIGIVFIGPCISKKLEADRNPGLPDVVLTFTELRDWLASEGIDITNPRRRVSAASRDYSDPMQEWFGIAGEREEDGAPSFTPRVAGETVGYAVEHGMIASLPKEAPYAERCASASGTHDVLEALTEIELGSVSGELMPEFFELLSCSGGCINGPGCRSDLTAVMRKVSSHRHTRRRLEGAGGRIAREHADLDIRYSFPQLSDGAGRRAKYGRLEIEQALVRLGKGEDSERLNCGGCGYYSCMEFAEACLEGMAEAEMCVTNMRKQAQSKVDVLLRTLPMGVVIVDNRSTIIDCNAQFLKMFSSVSYEAEERELQRVSGLRVDTFLEISSYFSQVFVPPYQSQRITLNLHDHIVKATFFIIEHRRLAGALFQDITEVSQRRDAVMRRAEDVIQKNLQSVQQIASLLGENAAETEIMLSSMIDLFEQPSERADRTV